MSRIRNSRWRPRAATAAIALGLAIVRRADDSAASLSLGADQVRVDVHVFLQLSDVDVAAFSLGSARRLVEALSKLDSFVIVMSGITPPSWLYNLALGNNPFQV